MSHSPRVLVDLIVVAARVRLVAKEVDVGPPFRLDVLQRVRLVPTLGEDVKGDLSADGVGQAVVGELLLESSDERLADVVLCVIRFELVSLLDAEGKLREVNSTW